MCYDPKINLHTYILMSTTIYDSFIKIWCKTKKSTLVTLSWISTSLKSTFLFYIRFWRNFVRLLYSWVLQSKKVSSKSNVNQKSLRFSDVESILQYVRKIKRLKLHIPVLYELGSCSAEKFVLSWLMSLINNQSNNNVKYLTWKCVIYGKNKQF